MEKLKYHIGVHHISTPWKFLIVLMILVTGFFGIFFSVKAYPEIFSTTISIEKSINIKPEESIVIDFSLPIFTENFGSGIKIIPEEKFELRWENSNKKMRIIPDNFWNPETKYEILMPQGKNIMLAKTKVQSLFFLTEKYPRVEKVIPKNNAEEVIIDIEDPITINFNSSVSSYSVKFTLNSKEDLFFESNLGETQFKLMPKNKIDYKTKYVLEVYIKYKKDLEKNYKKIFESSFETQLPPEILWDKDRNIRLSQARRYTPAKIKEGKYIDINLEAQILSIFESGELIDSFLVSSGKNGMDTPKIQTKIFNKAPRPFSKEYGLFMPFWMALVSDGKFGIHELPEWPGGYKEGANHLGIPVSHGCVRLGVGSAKRVYEWAEIGTPVVIY